MLTALTIHLFKAEKTSVAFQPVLRRIFLSSGFFMLISFILSYLDNFFVVF